MSCGRVVDDCPPTDHVGDGHVSDGVEVKVEEEEYTVEGEDGIEDDEDGESHASPGEGNVTDATLRVSITCKRITEIRKKYN